MAARKKKPPVSITPVGVVVPPDGAVDASVAVDAAAALGGQSAAKGVVSMLTPEQIEEAAIADITRMAVAGDARSTIEAACKARYGYSKWDVRRLVERIYAGLNEEFNAQKPFYRGFQARRIEGHLEAAKADKKWSAVAKFESELADIYGTREPTQADVGATVTHAAIAVLLNMTEDRRRELVERARAHKLIAENVVRAEQAQPVVTVVGVSVPTPGETNGVKH